MGSLLLEAIQVEQKEWAQKNFGDRPFWMPLLGMIEELGELEDSKNTAETLDAMADVSIYMMDYCTAKGWQIEDILERPVLLNRTYLSLAGWLARANLKQVQGIRGTAAEHDEKIKNVLSTIFYKMRESARNNGFYLEVEIQRVWDKVVKKRDWTKNKVTGEATVEASPPETPETD